MAGVRLTLTLSVVGHAAVLSALAWFGATAPPLRGSTDPKPVRVIFEPPPAPPPIPAVPVASALSPAPPAAEPPALVAEPEVPPTPDVTAMPPPPIAKPKPPVPEAKPEAKRRVQPRADRPPQRALPRAAQTSRQPPSQELHRRPVQPQEAALPPPVPPSWSPQPPRSAQTPSAPPPAVSQVTPGYRTALARWFEAHKRYPEGARARGEQGQAILRFRVDRQGRVLGYSIVRSTGYAELDAAVAAMMRGARLPPFPQDMAVSEIEVSVPLRFTVSP